MYNTTIQWLIGFTEAEGCFKVKPKYRNGKTNVHSFNFEFEIHLHIDDVKVLKKICDFLGIGKVYERESSKSCSFVVGNEGALRVLIDIFKRYPFNGIKLLDFIDFQEAFFLYFDRPGKLDEELISKILKLKSGMNKGREDFSMPSDHIVKITKYWLLGLIEGEGSFSLSREKLRPSFQLLFTAAQKPLLEEIKRYLISNLGFDRISLWKINNSSIIGIFDIKAKGNSKPTVILEIRDVNVLNNYVIPFLSSMSFMSKKAYDFSDFRLICQLLYIGAHKDSTIKELILRLSLTMNDFRLSTYKWDSSTSNKGLTSEEFSQLKEVVASATLASNTLALDLVEGDTVSSTKLGQDINNINGLVYQIKKSVYSSPLGPLDQGAKGQEEEILVASLKEAAGIAGVHYTTLSRIMASLPAKSKEANVKNNLIRVIRVFTGS